MLRNDDRQRGFTLVELMMVLAVAAVLVTVAIPSFSTLIKNNRLTTFTNTLVGSLVLARSEAVRRGRAVTVCASSNGTGCTATSWQQGWIVFTDAGTAGSVDGSDTLLRVQQSFGNDVAVSVTGSSDVRYAATGFLAGCNGDCAGRGTAVALAATEFHPTWQTALVTGLLPGRVAHAGNGNNNGGGGGGGGGQAEDDGGGGELVSSSFTFCDGRSGETGRVIRVAPSGRVSTRTTTCP